MDDKIYKSPESTLLLTVLVVGKMDKKVIVFLFLITVMSSACTNSDSSRTAAKIANPASSFCLENGNRLDLRTDIDGSQIGYCVLENGTECEEWSFYRGECGK